MVKITKTNNTYKSIIINYLLGVYWGYALNLTLLVYAPAYTYICMYIYVNKTKSLDGPNIIFYNS